MTNYKQKYEYWLQNAKDEEVRKSLAQMEGNDEEILNAFFKDIEFGTGGMRGIMAAGTNRLNVYTIFGATIGVAKYMQKHGMRSCAITYDSRNNSQKFSKLAAATLASFGIKVFVTKECMPTPYLSFLVRNYHTDMGINVTASHNAAMYNGYKVYDNDGCQILDETANELTEIIRTADPFAQPLPCFDDYLGTLIVYTDKDVEEKYKQTVLAQGLNDASGVKLVYSPLNGAGHRIVPEVLARAGVTDLIVVPEQAQPDGNFPTCPYPNPEKNEALRLALELAKSVNADAVVANDPDCDRLGTAILTENGYKLLTGNEVGVLLCDYVLSSLQRLGKLPQNAVIVKTIVTTLMVNKLAQTFNAQVVDVLTGFKYIGNVIKKLQDNGEEQLYVFGFEESCGYLKGTYVRDKDGVVASMLFCQCVAYYKKQGKTLDERLQELKEQYGNFVQKTFSYSFDGAEGAERKDELFAEIRKNPLRKLGNSEITQTTDFLDSDATQLPKSNVLRYNSQDGSQLVLRPSGTEPIVKCYVSVVGDETQAQQKLQQIHAQLDELIK